MDLMATRVYRIIVCFICIFVNILKKFTVEINIEILLFTINTNKILNFLFVLYFAIMFPNIGKSHIILNFCRYGAPIFFQFSC